MLFLVAIAIVVMFPLYAVRTARSGGPARLAVATLGALGLITTVALMASSARFGNRLAAEAGYAVIAGRTLAMAALCAGLPVILSAALAYASRRWTFTTSAMLALLAALLTFALGTVAAIYLLAGMR